jgi:hypothetical protein
MIDLYKAYIGDLGNIGSRYATSNGFYLSVITALVGVLALSEGKKPLADMRAELVVGISLVAVVVCWIWHSTIEFYGKLFRAKFQVLGDMELKLDYRVYAEEYKRIEALGAGSLTEKEKRVPLALGLLFALIAAAAVIAKLP